jgi:hypothetical protein
VPKPRTRVFVFCYPDEYIKTHNILKKTILFYFSFISHKKKKTKLNFI